MKERKEINRNRAKGMLWGLIVGDCLGDVLQFGPAREEGHFVTEMEAGGPFNTPAGYWTDDGSMALCIVDSYNNMGGTYSLADIAETFHHWYRDGYLSSLDHSFDVGCSTAQSIMRYAAQKTLVNGNEHSAGNGSIMRYAPSYLIGLAENDITGVTLGVSSITHGNCPTVEDTVMRLNYVVSDGLVGERTTDYGKYVRRLRNGKLHLADREDVTNRGFCIDTLDSALWAFHKTETFEDALVQAINNGNDSDSVGAVCGQIAGAYYGYDAIPRRWVEAVKDWEEIDAMFEKFLDLVFGKIEAANAKED